MTQTVNNGWVIMADDLIKEGTPAAVPLVAGFPLLLSALGGLGIAARRRRKSV